MTKEELIEKLIKARRRDTTERSMRLVCLDTNCTECPHMESSYCSADIIDDLLDYIINNELEGQETNFDHYIARSGVHITKERDVEAWEFRFKKGTEKQYFDANSKSIFDWLLAPYEEPKARYKLTQFEYDLLRTAKWSTHLFGEYDYLMNLKAIGYFQDITSAMAIVNVLDNAEVVDND